jgi:hypothetical protein
MPKLDFLNADLELIYDEEPRRLLRELKRKVIVLYSGDHPRGHLVALELNCYFNAPLKMMNRWVKLLNSLSVPARRELRAARSMVFDLGFDVDNGQRHDRVELPAPMLSAIAKLGAGYIVSLYNAEPKATSALVSPKRRKLVSRK